MNAMIILFVIFVVSSIWAILKSRKQGPRSRRTSGVFFRLRK